MRSTDLFHSFTVIIRNGFQFRAYDGNEERDLLDRRAID